MKKQSPLPHVTAVDISNHVGTCLVFSNVYINVYEDGGFTFAKRAFFKIHHVENIYLYEVEGFYDEEEDICIYKGYIMDIANCRKNGVTGEIVTDMIRINFPLEVYEDKLEEVVDSVYAGVMRVVTV